MPRTREPKDRSKTLTLEVVKRPDAVAKQSQDPLKGKSENEINMLFEKMLVNVYEYLC